MGCSRTLAHDGRLQLQPIFSGELQELHRSAAQARRRVVETGRADGPLDLCAVEAKGSRYESGGGYQAADDSSSAAGSGGNGKESLSREPAHQGLRLGIERRRGELWHATPGCEFVFAESGVRKYGTR